MQIERHLRGARRPGLKLGLASLLLGGALACADTAEVTDSGPGTDATVTADGARLDDAGPITGDAAPADAAPADLDLGPEPPEPDGGPPPADLAPPAPDQGVPTADAAPGPAPDAAPDPGPQTTCTWPGPADEREVNTWRGDTARVEFAVPGLPDPAPLTAAFVRFRGWDLDTPGEEGHLQVNDGPLVLLPADPALTNAHREEVMQIDPALLRAGRNVVRFHAFDRPAGAFFRISQVSIETRGPGPCVGTDPGPDPEPDDGRTGLGREATQGYREAAYTQRRNWVLDCRDYAYTGRGDEHTACDNQYRPDGTTHGTATFTFNNVVRDRYDVRIEGRLTENRNPRGMLVRINNEPGVRLDQRSNGEYAFQSAGEHILEGQVTVVIDSTRENGSDSVRRVQLQPVRN